MAVLWLEGFDADGISLTNHQRKYESVSLPSAPNPAGRWGGNAIGLAADPGNEFKTNDLGNKSNAICGFNYLINSNTGTFTEKLIVRLLDGSSEQISLYVLQTNAGYTKFRVKRGSTVIGTTNNQWLSGFWNLIEWKVILDTNGSNGTIELKVNGVSELFVDSIDTTDAASLVWNRFYFSANTQSGFPGRLDDVYLVDSSGGAPNNTYLGEVAVCAMFPNGNGNRSEWASQDGGGSHFSYVDDPVIDDASTYLYVWNADDDKVELFAMSDVTYGVDPVYAVLIESDLRMDNGGSDNFCLIFRNGGGSEATGASKTINQASAFKRFIEIYEQDPIASAAWTVSALNGFQFGIKSLA